MRRALPMLLATLALTIPHLASAALEGREARAHGVVPAGDSQAGTRGQQPGGVSQGQRNRPRPARGPQRGQARKGKKGYKRGNQNRGGVRYLPPAVALRYRAPSRYVAPYYDVRRTYLGRTGVSVSFLYSADWGDVYVQYGRPVAASVYVVPAPIAAPPAAYLRPPETIRIPPGHLPPPGLCRVWYPGRPPGHQPPPTDCDSAYWYAPPGSYIVYGG